RTRQTRLDTLELLNRLGATTAYTDLPAGGATSGASASRTTVSARGPAATVNQPVQSNITSGLERVLRLQAAAETIDLWRPWLVEVTQNEIELNRIQSELRASAQSLRGSVRQ